ncbi:hypothetical protein BDV96DRAFT_646494 [Lophiotrema nucula]|uniref:Uncharacterized protein n=1 Tax=Lophiotrema nucula TaxID=690887 RepID=A0A6A5Z8H5_9PLEO|nr:hypothetical protein BDV96DRAFT_646494 [Lophiotrema nucula]
MERERLLEDDVPDGLVDEGTLLEIVLDLGDEEVDGTVLVAVMLEEETEERDEVNSGPDDDGGALDEAMLDSENDGVRELILDVIAEPENELGDVENAVLELREPKELRLEREMLNEGAEDVRTPEEGRVLAGLGEEETKDTDPVRVEPLNADDVNGDEPVKVDTKLEADTEEMNVGGPTNGGDIADEDPIIDADEINVGGTVNVDVISTEEPEVGTRRVVVITVAGVLPGGIFVGTLELNDAPGDNIDVDKVGVDPGNEDTNVGGLVRVEMAEPEETGGEPLPGGGIALGGPEEGTMTIVVWLIIFVVGAAEGVTGGNGRSEGACGGGAGGALDALGEEGCPTKFELADGGNPGMAGGVASERLVSVNQLV